MSGDFYQLKIILKISILKTEKLTIFLFSKNKKL